ncbi:MAG TPA: hypothetical protein DCS07_11885 [Bdellovibrionales bacterium]|nr:hypothetical protein [Bdellovibrionales bacterium]
MTTHADCIQKDKIESIRDTLDRFEATHDRLIVVMEKIAFQDATLKSLQESAHRHDKAFENIFNRLGVIEVKSEGEKVKVGAIMAGISAAVALATTVLGKFLFH